MYATARSEKDARAAFASAIKREIGRDTIVVADGMNYIKGFRYQMFCEAKAVGTTSCVVRNTPSTPTHHRAMLFQGRMEVLGNGYTQMEDA